MNSLVAIGDVILISSQLPPAYFSHVIHPSIHLSRGANGVISLGLLHQSTVAADQSFNQPASQALRAACSTALLSAAASSLLTSHGGSSSSSGCA
jgi:hypothetical protein